jgi:hypothetical protein
LLLRINVSRKGSTTRLHNPAGINILAVQAKSTMKKAYFVFLLVIGLITGTQAQFKSVPAEVTNAFSSTYPEAKNVTWKSGFSGYEAHFDINGDAAVANYSNKGEWKETERNMQFDNLKSEIRDGFFKSKYSSWERKEVKELKEKDKDTLYRILVRESSLSKKYLYFNVHGQLVKDSMTL